MLIYEFIRDSNPIRAISAGNAFRKKETWKNIVEFIRARNLSFVSFVDRHLRDGVRWYFTIGSLTLESVRSSVPFARKTFSVVIS